MVIGGMKGPGIRCDCVAGRSWDDVQPAERLLYTQIMEFREAQRAQARPLEVYRRSAYEKKHRPVPLGTVLLNAQQANLKGRKSIAPLNEGRRPWNQTRLPVLLAIYHYQDKSEEPVLTVKGDMVTEAELGGIGSASIATKLAGFSTLYAVKNAIRRAKQWHGLLVRTARTLDGVPKELYALSKLGRAWLNSPRARFTEQKLLEAGEWPKDLPHLEVVQ